MHGQRTHVSGLFCSGCCAAAHFRMFKHRRFQISRHARVAMTRAAMSRVSRCQACRDVTTSARHDDDARHDNDECHTMATARASETTSVIHAVTPITWQIWLKMAVMRAMAMCCHSGVGGCGECESGYVDCVGRACGDYH